MGAKFMGFDFHELFPYQVPVVAVIKDARLGMLHLCLLGSIFCYIVIFQLWYLGGYLAKPELGMELRATLREPNKTLPIHDLSYCCGGLTCSMEETQLGKQKCLPFLGEEALIHQPNRFTVITHKRIQFRSLGERLTKGAADHIFVRGIERFTMKISPTIYSLSVRAEQHTNLIAGNKLSGRLFVGNANGFGPNEIQHQLCWSRSKEHKAFHGSHGDVAQDSAPCFIAPDMILAEDDDGVYHIETFLRALGLAPDALDQRRSGERGNSIRMSGLQVIVDVRIVSFEPGWGLVKPHYFLKQMLVNNSRHSLEFGGVSHTEGMQGLRRQTVENYGILFAFQVDGTLAHFEWYQVVVELSASFALLAASAAVVKYLALYVCPLGKVYHKAMHKVSPHIEDVERLLEKKDEKIKAAHKRFFHHDKGTKEDQALRLSGSHIDISSDSDESQPAAS